MPDKVPAKKMGRPRGTYDRTNRIQRRKAAEIVQSGLSPLDVMMSEMLFWDREMAILEKNIREKLPPGTSLLQVADDSSGVMAKFFEARKERRLAAEKAGPYVHPRISPITDPNGGASGGLKDLSKLTDADLDALERISRKIAGSYGDPGGEGEAQG